MSEITSGTGETGENIEAHRISVFLYGKRPEFLDEKIVHIDNQLGISITERDGTPLFRGDLDPA